MNRVCLLLMVFVLVFTFSCEKRDTVVNAVYQADQLQSITNSSTEDLGTLIFESDPIIRGKGAPVTEEIVLPGFDPNNNYVLVLTNGDENKGSKVTSCFVIFNGDTIICPIEITKDTETIVKELTIADENDLSARVMGKPDSYIILSIYEECALCPPTVTDIDGNVYETVLIGDQCWMKEDLNVAHYRNGDPIPNVTDNSHWSALSTGAYCYYENNSSNAEDYGAMYNWFAVNDERNLSPLGWHVPTDEEWKKLEMFLGMSTSEADGSSWRGTDEGGKLKESGTSHWYSPNIGATNESGFTARPGGNRVYHDGTFNSMGLSAGYWCSGESSDSEGWLRSLSPDNAQIHRSPYPKNQGLSLRCVKD